MQRKAIIIECSEIPGQDKLPGCASDASAWKTYLMSPVGGAWYAGEIDVIHNPNTTTVLSAIRGSSADYTFVTFSGHGYVESPSGRTFGCFRGGALSEDELTPRSDRATLVMDCCRGIAVEALTKIAMDHLREAVYNTSAYRRVFDDAALRAEKGGVRIFGCSFDEAAGEDRDGGAFTQNFIKVGALWATSGVLNQRDAFDQATRNVKRRHPQQNPEALFGRRQHHFPFAVNP